MTFPGLVLGVIISTIIPALVHLWRGGSLLRLVFLIAFGWIGFWVGHLGAAILGWTFLPLGSLYLGLALIGNIAGVVFGYWLSAIKPQPGGRK